MTGEDPRAVARTRWTRLKLGERLDPEVGDMVQTLTPPQGLGIVMSLIPGSMESPSYFVAAVVRLLMVPSVRDPTRPYEAGWGLSAIEVVEPGGGENGISYETWAIRGTGT